MLRHLGIISAFVLAASGAYAQTTPTACDPATFVPACDTGATTSTELDVCQGATCTSANASTTCTATGDTCDTQAGTCTHTGTVTPVDCTTFAAGAACGDPPGCDGSGCAQLDPPNAKTCVAQVGGTCDGLSPDITGDTQKAQLIGLVLCAADATCLTTVTGTNPPAATDACVAHTGAACTATGDAASCEGTVLSICLQDSGHTVAIKSNLAIDCASIATTCGPQPCACDAQCNSDSTGTNKCVNGTCDFGATCITPTAQLATCGTGEGEGEGEGAGTGGCNQDTECGQDQVCDNGTCKAATTPPEQKPSCSDTGAGTAAPLAGLVAIIGLVPMFRRRRRA
jgi:hypothetical protein